MVARRSEKAGCLCIDGFARLDFDTKAAKPDISALGRGQKPDRGNSEVLEDLRAEPNLAPLPRTSGLGAGAAVLRNFGHRNTGGAITQVNDHAAALALETRERRADGLGAAEHVADHIGTMQPRQHALAVADAAIDEGHVVNLVERRHVGVAVERADLGGELKLADPLDQLV